MRFDKSEEYNKSDGAWWLVDTISPHSAIIKVHADEQLARKIATAIENTVTLHETETRILVPGQTYSIAFVHSDISAASYTGKAKLLCPSGGGFETNEQHYDFEMPDHDEVCCFPESAIGCPT